MSTRHLSPRVIVEWALSASALAVVATVILAMDNRTREYAKRALAGGDTGLNVPQNASHVVRAALDLCRDHQPLAIFVGVACVLVLFMRQMR